MQVDLTFNIQNIFFNKLKNNKVKALVFKILEETVKEKYILIESIKQNNASFNRIEVDVVLEVFANSFNYSVLEVLFNEIQNLITNEAFAEMKGFVNCKMFDSNVFSNIHDGFKGKIGFKVFFMPLIT